MCVAHITRMSAQERVPTCWVGPVDPDCDGLSDVFPWMDDQTQGVRQKRSSREPGRGQPFAAPALSAGTAAEGLTELSLQA